MSESIAQRIFRFFFPAKYFTSGTADHPIPEDLFIAMLVKLLREGKVGSDWVHFDVIGSKEWVEVALDEDDFLLNFSYKFEDDPIKRLTEQGIDIPQHWKVDYLMPGTAATLAVPIIEPQDLASMIDNIFQRSLGCPENYQIKAHLE